MLAADTDRPVEDLLARAALLGGHRHDPAVDLLEDPRHGRHERRGDDRQVVDDPVDPAVHRGGRAGRQLGREQHLAERVRQRQPQVLHVVRGQQLEGVDRHALVDPAVLGEPDALRAAGRAAGVDQRRELLGPDRVDAAPHQVGVVGEPLAPAGRELVQPDHPLAVRRALEGDHGAQRRQLVAVVAQLGDLGVVLGEGHHRPGVGHDVGDVLRVGARVDGGRGRPGAEHREVGQHPLDPGGGDQRHPLLRLHAEVQQAGGEVLHPLAGLAPGDRLPAGTDRAAVGLPRRRRGDPVEEHPPDRRRAVGDGVGAARASCPRP